MITDGRVVAREPRRTHTRGLDVSLMTNVADNKQGLAPRGRFELETLHCNNKRELICLTYGFSVNDSRSGCDTPVAQTAGSRVDSLWNHVEPEFLDAAGSPHCSRWMARAPAGWPQALPPHLS
jgi:hypothetical protein